VGGFAQSLVLSALGHEAVLAPTVLFGRHPGLGPPGGASVAVETFEGVLEGVERQGGFGRFDLILTGYFADPRQASAAVRVIDAARVDASVRVLVDPVMGDAGKGLYVRPEVAEVIKRDLAPRADILTPNLWELGFLAGADIDTLEGAVLAARSFSGGVAMTSAPAERGWIGVLAVENEARLYSHAAAASAPNGTGDLFSALLASALLDGLTFHDAVRQATGGVADAVQAAKGELPLVALSAHWRAPQSEVTETAL
jgi:pyridoxine kinase